jgi:hypothetical protein
VAYSGNGLRCEGMHAKRPEGPTLSGQRTPLPARAMSAQVKLASPVYPVYPVRRADRGSASITRLIHLSPPAGPLPAPGPRSCPILITHRVNKLSPRAARAATGHHRPAQNWPAAPTAIIAPGRCSAPAADSASSRAGRTTRIPSACPPADTERPLPLPDTGQSRYGADIPVDAAGIAGLWMEGDRPGNDGWHAAQGAEVRCGAEARNARVLAG